MGVLFYSLDPLQTISTQWKTHLILVISRALSNNQSINQSINILFTHATPRSAPVKSARELKIV